DRNNWLSESSTLMRGSPKAAMTERAMVNSAAASGHASGMRPIRSMPNAIERRAGTMDEEYWPESSTCSALSFTSSSSKIPGPGGYKTLFCGGRQMLWGAGVPCAASFFYGGPFPSRYRLAAGSHHATHEPQFSAFGHTRM